MLHNLLGWLICCSLSSPSPTSRRTFTEAQWACRCAVTHQWGATVGCLVSQYTKISSYHFNLLKDQILIHQMQFITRICLFLDCWWNQSFRRRSTKVQRENAPSRWKGAWLKPCQEACTSYTIYGPGLIFVHTFLSVRFLEKNVKFWRSFLLWNKGEIPVSAEVKRQGSTSLSYDNPLPGQTHTGQTSTKENTERVLFCGSCAGQCRQVGVKW